MVNRQFRTQWCDAISRTTYRIERQHRNARDLLRMTLEALRLLGARLRYTEAVLAAGRWEDKVLSPSERDQIEHFAHRDHDRISHLDDQLPGRHLDAMIEAFHAGEDVDRDELVRMTRDEYERLLGVLPAFARRQHLGRVLELLEVH